MTDVTFDFLGLGGCACCCRARVFGAGAAPVVVLTELADNPGTSVTNAVESLAAQFCECYELDGADVVWVEHYPDARAQGERDASAEERFAAVNFNSIEARAGGWRFHGPRWAPMTRARVEALSGQAWRADE